MQILKIHYIICITINQIYKQKNKMKTVQSFFPTSTKSKPFISKQKTYKVMIKVMDDQDLSTQEVLPAHKYSEQISSSSPQIQNIFRHKKNSLKYFPLQQRNQRPVGGIQLFRKMEKGTNSHIEESASRMSKKDSNKNTKSFRDQSSSNHLHNQPVLDTSAKNNTDKQVNQQTFKQHTDNKEIYNSNTIDQFQTKSIGKYRSQPGFVSQNSRKISVTNNKCSVNLLRMSGRNKNNQSIRPQSGNSSSLQSLRQSSEPRNSHLEWASEQQQKYLDKMAILNEISYNRPLIQKLGDKYFEGILRNRYMDELEYKHRSPFIYQIKDKLSDTKFISKVKSMKCNFMERSKIIVKGRNKLFKELETKKDAAQQKKRWEDWNDNRLQA